MTNAFREPRDPACRPCSPGYRRVRIFILVPLTTLFAGGGLFLSSSTADDNVAALFVNLCSVCHGAEGKGDGPSAAGLHPTPPDFTNCAAMAARSDATLSTAIRDGGQSVGRSAVMPPWTGALNDRQIGDLVVYIRGLCKR
jgi:cytochrome c oxidase cbb3-type subunit 3